MENVKLYTYYKKNYFLIEKNNDVFFSEFDINESKKFVATYQSNEEDEIFFIKLDNEEENFIAPFLKLEEQQENINNFNYLEDVNKINNIFYKMSDKIFFKRIFNKNFIVKKTMIFFDSKLKMCDKLLIINNEEIDAIYDINEKKLYFKIFKKIAPIFDGIEKFYREATKNDWDNFKNNSILDCSNLKQTNSKIVLKKIAAIEDGNMLKNITTEDLYNKIKDIDSNLNLLKFNLEKNKIIIENNKDISVLYDILNDRYYRGPINNKAMYANSNRKLSDE